MSESIASLSDAGEGGPWLLVTDVDDTLTGDDEALGRFIALIHECRSIRVALNSSRPTASVLASMRRWPAPFEPDAIIGAMGTQVLWGREPDSAWAGRFTGWDRAVVDRIMAGLGFQPHDEEFQTPLKASYAVPAHRQDEAVAAIEVSGQPARIVRSGASDFDVLPPGADKAAACLHVARLLAIAPDRLIVAGDSANDLAMFNAADRGILVANARRELIDAVDPSRVYRARGLRADGLIEGLRHYGAIAVEAGGGRGAGDRRREGAT